MAKVLPPLEGMTHSQIREWVRARSLEAESIRYDNPFDPDHYTIQIIRWPNGAVLWNEICKRCAAIVDDRPAHDRFHTALLLARLAGA